MTDNIEEIVGSLSLNHILIAILEQQKKIIIPTTSFLDAGKTDKELVIDYDNDGPSFIIGLREKGHTHDDGTTHSHD
ncbi:MAG: hypothetical protein RLZZ196_3 [Bacteroidota bacterium]|jgi:hypothetical protein